MISAIKNNNMACGYSKGKYEFKAPERKGVNKKIKRCGHDLKFFTVQQTRFLADTEKKLKFYFFIFDIHIDRFWIVYNVRF